MTVRHVLFDADGVVQSLRAGSIAPLERWRERGFGVHLATNQSPERRDHMRSVLGYDDEFDESFYSCEIGAAKPDPGFFTSALARLDAPPDQVLFVDDNQGNVDGARNVGLRAEQWQLQQGQDQLRTALARHLD